MGKRNLPRSRRFVTFRLPEKDHRLLREIGKKRGLERYQALLELVDVIPQLELPEKSSQRRPMRIGLPTELDEVLQAAKERSGVPYLDILLAAARKYEASAPQNAGEKDAAPIRQFGELTE